jgi:hypothetical protein
VTDADTALILARAQFAFTISFHFIFPAFSIGLASYLAVLEALWLKTGKEVYMNLFRYWLKIFAIAVWNGRRFRHRHDLSVRHELVGLFGSGRADHRSSHGL